MSDRDPQGPLSDEDVEQVSRLIESLDRSGFDFLQVEVGDLRITIGTGEPPGQPVPTAPPAMAAAAVPAVVPEVVPAAAPAAVPAVNTSTAAAAPADGTLEVTTPTMGIFYSRPEPGKPPFVAVGDLIEESTTVGLVEVMKTFHAVAAGVRGTVGEICVADAQLVEFGDVLMRVVPAAAG